MRWIQGQELEILRQMALLFFFQKIHIFRDSAHKNGKSLANAAVQLFLHKQTH
jgi:hypothetical protein